MKTWSEKLHARKSPRKKRIDRPFAGKPAGAMMYISTPEEIDAYVKAIPSGQAVSVERMRDELASRHDADFTCPLTTGLYLRIVAEAAFERLNSASSGSVTPFWRIIEPDSKLAARLSFDPNFIRSERAAEGIDGGIRSCGSRKNQGVGKRSKANPTQEVADIEATVA